MHRKTLVKATVCHNTYKGSLHRLVQSICCCFY